MQIRKGMSEDSGEQCYALVSELLFFPGAIFQDCSFSYFFLVQLVL